MESRVEKGIGRKIEEEMFMEAKKVGVAQNEIKWKPK